jgi:phosphopantothenoylcysteine decarboxylase / phosphopantothenate---cysteine ligase
VLSDLRAGISDDLLTATLLATRAPVVVCPAMHTEMWEHPAVQDNLVTLRAAGVHVVRPRRAASPAATSAPAAWPTPPPSSPPPSGSWGPGDLAGLTVLVTAGGTREPIDPVRFIGNRSSGKQGYASPRRPPPVAPGHPRHHRRPRPVPAGVDVVPVETAAEMEAAVLPPGRRRRRRRDGRRGGRLPAGPVAADHKIKKDGVPEIVLEPTPTSSPAWAPPSPRARTSWASPPRPTTCGPTPRPSWPARALDLIVANDVSAPGVGFEHDTNAVVHPRAGGPADRCPPHRQAGRSPRRARRRRGLPRSPQTRSTT